MNPKSHPNAYLGLSTGSVAAFLITEAKRRLGVDLTVDEAAMIVTGSVSLALFAGRHLGVVKP